MPGEATLSALHTADQQRLDAILAASPHLNAPARNLRIFPPPRGSCVHRAATCQAWQDALTWPTWADAASEMAIVKHTRPQND